ncbi:unnamed protein product [Rhodiola kirilowii]
MQRRYGMAGGDKRIRVDDDGADRISELPVHLREHILEYLYIWKAVATSVLSSKWRFCWTGLRKLQFDEDFWCVNLPLDHERVIDRILLLHSGPIREFTLFIPEINYDTLDITVWLRVLSNKGVQKIEIDAVEYHYKNMYYPIPSCLYHCRELKELSLRGCKTTLPCEFKGFANLTSLSLDSVDIASSLLGSLISGCLLLETLSLKDLRFQKPLVLESLNLKTLYLYLDYCLKNIIFKDIPKLTCVSLLATEAPDRIETPQTYNTLDLFCSFSKIEELTIDIFLLELDPEFRRGFESKSKVDYGEAAKLLESEAKKYESYNSLQTIKIGGIAMLRHEILLINLLQKCCPKLKSIGIKKWG